MGQFFILRSKVQQEYNGLLVNALYRIFNSNLSLNNFKWMLTKVELSCVRNIIPRSKKRLGNGYPVLNQELQNHNPFLRHIPVKVMYGSTFQSLVGFRIPWAVFQIPKPRILDFTRKNFPDSGIRITLHGAKRTKDCLGWIKKNGLLMTNLN